MWFIYIILCGDGTLYTGITNDVDKRIKKHESGKGAKYTRGRGPFVLKYVEQVENKSQALKREYVIKQLSKDQKLRMIRLWE